jgi:hypothetical protein
VNFLSDQSNKTIYREFLIASLRSLRQTAFLGHAKALAQDSLFKWEILSKLALDEGLAPLLYQRLDSEDWVPEPIQAVFQKAFLDNGTINLVLFHELDKILLELEESQLACILLKGAALAPLIYKDLALRPMVDIDLLVHPQDLQEAQQILITLGYQPYETELRGDAALQFDNEKLLVKASLRITQVELHWSLFDSPYHQANLPMEWFWQTSMPAAAHGRTSRILSPEAQILHLCGHLWLHHTGRELLGNHDIAEWIFYFQDEIDWDELLERAMEFHLVVPIKEILPAIQAEFGAPIPGTFLDSLEAIDPSPTEVEITKSIRAPERASGERFWDDLHAILTLSAKFTFAWQKIFPSWEYMRRRYNISNPFLLPLYYIYRVYLGFRTSR